MISVITCAYQPEDEVFKPVLKAIMQLKCPVGETVEYIIIDNAGGLSQKDYIRDFLAANKAWARIVEEKKPGLTQARLRGLDEGRGEYLVFFDQDNEPNDDYLLESSKLLQERTSIGILGPGNVTVIFTGDAENWVKKNARTMMQELHMKEEAFTSDAYDFPYLPFGTGMVVRRRIMEVYKQKVVSGVYTIADKSGNELTSGGDLQIVFTASRAGWEVGRTPRLTLNHLISPSKSNFQYVKRFSYGNGLATFPVVAQAYPEKVSKPGSRFYETLLFIYQCTREFFRQGVFRWNRKMMTCKIAALIAFKRGQFGFYSLEPPKIIDLAKRWMGL